MDNVGLAVAAGLPSVALLHIAESKQAVLHVAADEQTAEESEGGVDILKATDKIGLGQGHAVRARGGLEVGRSRRSRVLVSHNQSSFLKMYETGLIDIMHDDG